MPICSGKWYTYCSNKAEILKHFVLVHILIHYKEIDSNQFYVFKLKR